MQGLIFNLFSWCGMVPRVQYKPEHVSRFIAQIGEALSVDEAEALR